MIVGERVVLRALEPEDAERCKRWINDPEVTHGLMARFPLSLAQERRWVEQERDPTRELHLAIETQHEEHIGNCGLLHVDAVQRSAALGIMIGEKEYWGQGYGSDAVLTLCGFAFRQMNLHRVSLRVLAFNERAAACYRRCGFREEGRLREAVFKHGEYHDVLVMGLLAREHREQWPERWGG